MYFIVKFHRAFIPEWRALDVEVKERAGEIFDHLQEEGPLLGRPEVDTLKGSAFGNMKEIRFRLASEVWRLAFAFDSRRTAVILCSGAKQGMDQTLFYRRLIAKADARFQNWLEENGRGQ